VRGFFGICVSELLLRNVPFESCFFLSVRPFFCGKSLHNSNLDVFFSMLGRQRTDECSLLFNGLFTSKCKSLPSLDSLPPSASYLLRLSPPLAYNFVSASRSQGSGFQVIHTLSKTPIIVSEGPDRFL